MRRVWLLWLVIPLGCILGGIPSSWSAGTDNDPTYVLPLSTQNITEIRLKHLMGTLDILGTSKPSAHMVFQRVDNRSFTDTSFLPRVSTPETSVLEIRPPGDKKHYVSPLQMTLYLPRMNTVSVEGDSVQLKVKEVPHLKVLRVDAKHLDLNLYQRKLQFDLKADKGDIFVSRCDQGKGKIELQAGKVYLKQSSGEYQISGKNLKVFSNQVRGSQTYVVDGGKIKLLDAQGTASIKGVSAPVVIQGSLPEDLSVSTRSGDISLQVASWDQAGDNISWDIQAPVGRVLGLPSHFEAHRMTHRRREKIKRALLQAQKQITLQTLTGSIRFLLPD